jgi:hypothetical protein
MTDPSTFWGVALALGYFAFIAGVVALAKATGRRRAKPPEPEPAQPKQAAAVWICWHGNWGHVVHAQPVEQLPDRKALDREMDAFLADPTGWGKR